MKKSLILAALLLIPAGCGDESKPMVPVALDALPAGSLDAAKKRLPEVTFERARKSTYNGKDSLEIIGKDKKGKLYEVEVSTTGEILDVE